MFKKVLIASALLVSAIGANAAGSAPFAVSGTGTPGACDVTLGAAVDFGTRSLALIKTSTVTTGPTYQLAAKTTTIAVVCSAATKAELSFTDNKPSARFVMDGNDGIRYGLSDGSGTAAIGSYQIVFTNVLIDSVAAAGVLTAPTGTTTWSKTGINGLSTLFSGSGYSTGFTKAAANLVPDSFTNLTATLSVDVFLSKAYIDSATNAVSFNGGSVITVQYL